MASGLFCMWRYASPRLAWKAGCERSTGMARRINSAADSGWPTCNDMVPSSAAHGRCRGRWRGPDDRAARPGPIARPDDGACPGQVRQRPKPLRRLPDSTTGRAGTRPGTNRSTWFDIRSNRGQSRRCPIAARPSFGLARCRAIRASRSCRPRVLWPLDILCRSCRSARAVPASDAPRPESFSIHASGQGHHGHALPQGVAGGGVAVERKWVRAMSTCISNSRYSVRGRRAATSTRSAAIPRWANDCATYATSDGTASARITSRAPGV